MNSDTMLKIENESKLAALRAEQESCNLEETREFGQTGVQAANQVTVKFTPKPADRICSRFKEV